MTETEPLFLKPYFQPKIWGGRKLATQFGYQIPDGKIGECWAISAHPHGPSTIKNGPLAGETLAEAWASHREYFGNVKGNVFPLLTKILDAEASLSVQVHPDDAYAAEHEHELGKTECWYIIDADPGSYLIYGHTAKTQAELKEMIDNGEWDKLLKKVPVKKGDFFYVPSGTVHALNKGIMALETQQSSDTTYRLYDYDRVGDDGKKRELHIDQSLDTITVPAVDPDLHINTRKDGKNATVTTFIEPPVSPHFSVYQWKLDDGTLSLRRGDAPYTLVSVIDGTGALHLSDGTTYQLKKGVHFILPYQIKEWTLTGTMNIIASEPSKDPE
ncbi:mannose-6-phosphate isomerase, class I [Lactobacillus selangorensis]|uniref:Mannose-6-phosphate isomerase n=1 Tax=Lactobacillus selangorensis TaxID=81857 RepID=A0A0R2FTV5_9LACO|nr:mannose-6-phosphate isomerase, class I [Lactobacillus selangorensis]KRN28341.1 mannose-6-phosphate isomerase, class I [Lactobacillus selangorensis]KRN31843.1 mannose-6-phosphate isomerase, class I [Lactobacillus selangorensis]